jgi:hypothetical protein
MNNLGQVGIILYTTREWTRHTWKYERVTHLRCWYEHFQTLSTGVSSGRSVSKGLTLATSFCGRRSCTIMAFSVLHPGYLLNVWI